MVPKFQHEALKFDNVRTVIVFINELKNTIKEAKLEKSLKQEFIIKKKSQDALVWAHKLYIVNDSFEFKKGLNSIQKLETIAERAESLIAAANERYNRPGLEDSLAAHPNLSAASLYPNSIT